MQQAVGRRTWAIAEGYIPGWSHGSGDMISHEAACILNASDQDALITTVAFASD